MKLRLVKAVVTQKASNMRISGFYDTTEPNGRTVYINKIMLSPKPSQKVFNHSPDGFEWGYSGSGPAQLALAILMTIASEKTAVRFHQDFKRDFVSKWKKDDDFEVNINVRKWLHDKRKNGHAQIDSC